MPAEQLKINNSNGELLSAALDLPSNPPKFYALFAHCFTCSKNTLAATYISKKLVEKDIAVLRFDFTGLGNSAGDFADTNFSSNLEDIILISKYLQTNYQGPALLIGHSLGGAAVLSAAQSLDSVKAVVTIGSPATADHVQHLFSEAEGNILNNSEALVDIGGRKFKIKKQFIEDISRHNTTEHLAQLNKALLIFHSPADNIVSIDEAAKIYQASKHPKSFVSLENADHLLSNKMDAIYVAEIISSWASRYLYSEQDIVKPRAEIQAGTVVINEENQRFTRTIYTNDHKLIADEPVSAGGDNLGPDPYEFLLTALGSCTSMTIRMYANKKNIPLKNIEISLSHKRIHAEDCDDCEKHEGIVDLIDKHICLTGELSEQQRQKLMEIASKCPVHKTLLNEIVIHSYLQE